MRVCFYCDNGISTKEVIFDVEKDLGFTAEEWMSLSEDDKYKQVESWAWNYLDIGWEEVKDD